MGLREEYYLKKYEEIKVLSDTKKCRTSIVRNIDTGELGVKKEMSVEAYEIYEQLKSIKNDYLVDVKDCFIVGDFCVAIEEYVDGRQLSSIIPDEGMECREAVNCILQLCSALKAVHTRGIVHRDIQPKNVIITKEATAKLIDFDIARQQKAGSTKDTSIFGTVGYASPEQYGFAQTDARSDIYSLGVLLRTMITGSENGDFKSLKKKELMNRGKTNVSKLISIIEKCTEMDPKNRYGTVEELEKELNKCIGNEEQKIKKLPPITWKYVLRTIPGFRSGNVIFEIFATLMYLLMLITHFQMALAYDCKNIILYFVLIVLFELLFIIPYAYLTNIAQIAERFPRKNYKTKVHQIIYQIIYSVIIYILILFITALFVPGNL